MEDKVPESRGKSSQLEGYWRDMSSQKNSSSSKSGKKQQDFGQIWMMILDKDGKTILTVQMGEESWVLTRQRG